jgi:hypothetical protein
VLAWYYDGAFAWSENDPASNGPGKGYLLAVDSNPNELPFPGATAWMQGDPSTFDTRYVLEGDATQASLREALMRTMCFVREPSYVPVDVVGDGLAKLCKVASPAPGRSVDVGGAKAMLGTQYSDLLPGADRDGWRPVGELHDFRVRDGAISYRLNDRSLRSLHTYDNPFATTEMPRGIVVYDVVDGALVEREARSHPAVTTFDDGDPSRWLNPNLNFGGVAVPTEGLSWVVSEPAPGAPPGTRATVTVRWATQGG